MHTVALGFVFSRANQNYFPSVGCCINRDAMAQSRPTMGRDAHQVSTLLAIPDGFRQTALSFPDKIDAALKLVETPAQGKRMLDQADAMSHFARRIKADTEVCNAISYGKLKITARLGELLPAIPPKERGRGNKKNGINGDPILSEPSAKRFRRVHKHEDKLADYRKACDDGEEELTTGGFIRFATGTEKAGTSAHVSENTGIPEWYTPTAYIEAAREVLGEIDLDPASSDIAQKTVRAKDYFTVDDDGLKNEWRGKIWMNPPYTSGTIERFISKIIKHFPRDIPEAIVLVNNATETKWFQEIATIASAICFPSGRIKFLDETGEPRGTPLQGQAVIYLGDHVAKFIGAFSSFGFCVKG